MSANVPSLNVAEGLGFDQLLDAIEGGKIPVKLIHQDTVARLSWHRDLNLQT